MGNEVHFDFDSGETLYFIRFNDSGQVAVSDGSSFENYGSGGHDKDDYDVSLTENGTGSGHYVGSWDASDTLSKGRYSYAIFLQAGANPSDSDPLIGVSDGKFVWAGSGELTTEKILTNKAVQNKNTGVIQYYDDDDTTVILTHTPTDAESTITRMPS